MDHAFELAFNLCDEAAGRITDENYGLTRIVAHNHGDVRLSTVHRRTPDGGHRLVLHADDEHGLVAAIEATAPDRYTAPTTRIVRVRAGELIFHALPANPWAWRARDAAHTYQLAAALPDELISDDDPLWTATLDDAAPVDYDALDDAVDALLDHHRAGADA